MTGPVHVTRKLRAFVFATLLSATTIVFVAPGADAGSRLVFSDNFDDGSMDSSKWQWYGYERESNQCGYVSYGNSLQFRGWWNEAYMKTRNGVDVLRGGNVQFYLHAGGDGWGYCEYTSYSLTLEYSTNGGSQWFTLNTYNPSSYRYSFYSVYVELPEAAWSKNTMFRWRVYSPSDYNYDHWAMDDVRIYAYPVASNVPTSAYLGPDADGDRIPSSVRSAQNDVYSDGSREYQGESTLVGVDGNDNDPTYPVGPLTRGASAQAGCQADAVCVSASAYQRLLGTNYGTGLSYNANLDPYFDQVEGATGLRPVSIGTNSATVRAAPASAGVCTPSVARTVLVQTAAVGPACAAWTRADAASATTPGVVATGPVDAAVGGVATGSPDPVPYAQEFVLRNAPESATVPVPGASV